MDELLAEISELQSPCGGDDGDDEQGSSPVQGVEGGVVVISRMLPDPEASANGRHGTRVDFEAFSNRIYESWGIGKRECSNGFLLFASKEDRNFAMVVVSLYEAGLVGQIVIRTS